MPARTGPGPGAPDHRGGGPPLGFISPTHFSRVFRATYGMSPSEWQGAAS
ncbi:AraC family transcriptional regulator [Streptomyces sp. FXJ1.4098]|nr:AraC family transcriptional regulator [Streptomyces sp. FXJ1.4098]